MLQHVPQHGHLELLKGRPDHVYGLVNANPLSKLPPPPGYGTAPIEP
jgi:hypothetical protein